jgi:iron complex transport system ATP-binding protein
VALVEIDNIEFSHGENKILRDISFAVETGEVFLLLGPNGSGKTTLLDCILGALPLNAGRISLNGSITSSFRPGTLARFISYVPQRHESGFPYTVFQMVTMGRAAYTGLFSSPTSADRDIAEAAIDAVGITHLKKRPYTRLSGGEGQLVLMARALAQNTPIILMDEPTAHLDFKNELLVLETIARLVNERQLSVIMATHFPNHAFFFENNAVPITVALLEKGRLIAKGSPEKVLREDLIGRVYGVHAEIISCQTGGQNGRKQVVPIRTII